MIQTAYKSSNQTKLQLISVKIEWSCHCCIIGNCIALAGTGTLNQVRCNKFRKGCPDKPYLSDSIYQRKFKLINKKSNRY